MSNTLSLQATLSAQALLSRSAGHDAHPYERAMRDCLATAHAALMRCPPGPLRQRLRQELADLAACCERDAEAAHTHWTRSGDDADLAQLRMSRRIAVAARDLSALAAVDEAGVH